MNNFSKEAERFEHWFRNDVIPLWVNVGYDHKRGGFFETLDFDGSPNALENRRTRVQSRQLYVMTRIAILGWHDGAEALANDGFDYLDQVACPNKGLRGCVHLLAPDGSVIDPTRDLYDQAFILLACAWRWRWKKDDRALKLASRTIAFLEDELASPFGGWVENDKVSLTRRQNPHMHLFEAFMALYEATGQEKYLRLAGKVFKLFEISFFEPVSMTLREFFTDKLMPIPGEQGLRIEPGHMVEWVWLLSAYDRLTGVDTTAYCTHLFDKARDIGIDPRSTFLVDGLILGGNRSGGRRLWPQTEYIKACCIMIARGSQRVEKIAAELISQSFQTYFKQSVPGLWYDQFDIDGKPIASSVPASILYHLIDAVLACKSVAEATETSNQTVRELEDSAIDCP